MLVQTIHQTSNYSPRMSSRIVYNIKYTSIFVQAYLSHDYLERLYLCPISDLFLTDYDFLFMTLSQQMVHI